MFLGIVLIIFSLPLYFLSYHVAVLLLILGILILLINQQRNYVKNINKIKAIKKYQEIKYDEPISKQTMELAKNYDISPNINSHKVWLIDAVNALEKQYRKSKTKMFLYNRNRSAAKPPYITINLENMNYKKNQNYEKLFYKNGNYNQICNFLKRSTITTLEKELYSFTQMIEKKEKK